MVIVKTIPKSFISIAEDNIDHSHILLHECSCKINIFHSNNVRRSGVCFYK